MDNTSQTFQLTWLTSTPLLRGNRVAMVLSLIPAVLAVISLVITLGLEQAAQGPTLLSGALFLSLSAILIQFPSYLGRVELNAETLTVAGRLHIPRQDIRRAYFAPLTRPPLWFPFIWGTAEVLCGVGALSAGWGSGSGHWYWLTILVTGLSFWPLMAARRQANLQVVLVYRRPGEKEPGLIRAWATPQQASSLLYALQGKIDREAPRN